MRQDIREADIRQIKRVLCWPRGLPLPRCQAKDKVLLRKLEADGDFSHSSPKHAPCDICRCKKAAGHGTKGDFYGLGEHTGHLGVGFCTNHERAYCRRGTALMAAEKHMRALQAHGDAPILEADYIDKLETDAVEALERAEHRQSIALVSKTLQEWYDVTDSKKKLTELSGGKPIQITGKSRIELGLKIANSLSKLKIDEFKLSSSEYIHVDDLLVRMPQMIALLERYIERIEDRQRCIEEFKLLWSNVPTGVHDRRRSRQHELVDTSPANQKSEPDNAGAR